MSLFPVYVPLSRCGVLEAVVRTHATKGGCARARITPNAGGYITVIYGIRKSILIVGAIVVNTCDASASLPAGFMQILLIWAILEGPEPLGKIACAM
jgi:hypothetical protein